MREHAPMERGAERHWDGLEGAMPLKALNIRPTAENSPDKGNPGLLHHGHERLTILAKQSL